MGVGRETTALAGGGAVNEKVYRMGVGRETTAGNTGERTDVIVYRMGVGRETTAAFGIRCATVGAAYAERSADGLEDDSVFKPGGLERKPPACRLRYRGNF